MSGQTPIDEIDLIDDNEVDMTTPIDELEDAVSPVPVMPDPVDPDDSVDDLSTSEIGEKKNWVWRFGGREYDADTGLVMMLIIAIWVAIWWGSGLYKTLSHSILFVVVFWIFILYTFINFLTSGVTSGGVVHELNILLTVEQMISILFGTVVLFTLFFERLPLHPNCSAVVFNISISILIILTMASMWVNVITTGRSFRAIRKFKQGIYNIALSLFILIAIIFIKGNKGRVQSC